MNKYKILLFSDLHLGLLNKYVSDAYNYYKRIINEIFSLFYDKWIFLGDLFDNVKKKISLQEMSILYNLITHKDSNLFFLYGNHDLLYPSNFTDKTLLEQEPIYNFFPNNKIELNYYENLNTLFIFISYISPLKEKEVYDYLKEKLNIIKIQNLQINNIIGFTHLDYKEILPLQEGYSFDELSSIISSYFPNTNIIFFNGHYHEKSKYNNSYGKLINIGSSLMNNKTFPLEKFTVNNIPSIVILTVSKNSKVEYSFLPLKESVLYSQVSAYAYFDIFKNSQISNPMILEYKSDKIDYSLVESLKEFPNVINVLVKKISDSSSEPLSNLASINETSSTNISYEISNIIKTQLIEYIKKQEKINDKMKERLLQIFTKEG